MTEQTNINKTIGQNLRTLRKLKGVSMQTLASGLGITYQQLQKYETGQNRLRIDTILEIADLLAINGIELFEIVTNNKNKKTWEDFRHTKDSTDLMSLWQKIDDVDQKKAFLRLLEIMQ